MYFVIGGVPSGPIFLWIPLNSCPLTWFLIIVMRLNQKHGQGAS